MSDGFNIVLCRNKLLAELDRTVYEIRRGLNFEKAGNTLDTRIRGGHDLLDKNCYVGTFDRATLFKEISPCLELRIINNVPVEAFIFHEGIEDNGKFDIEALKPDGKGSYLFGERAPIHVT